MLSAVALFAAFSALLLSAVYSVPLDSRAGQTFTGDGTVYQPALGACGISNTADQLIVAVGHGLFDSYPGATANPNLNPICGKKLKASYNGKSVTVTVEDRCAGCAGADDLDFAQAAWTELGQTESTRIHGVKWEWV
ncbi:plant expansin [Mycena pura]|uniref:Plant expansin n=1 Tax=Mycena pura TaxID=153505 RepID=A0AAD6YM98_9AGAR|nr:plant expansin [Mycena pura]